MSRLISQFLCNLNSLRNFTCPSGKLITEWTSPIAKSTSPGLSDTTFWVDGSLEDHPSYPGRANFAYIALKHLANLLDEKQKVGSARRVTRLARSSFLHKNTLARPVIPAKGRKSEHARELLARASKGVKGYFFQCDSTGKEVLFPGATFLRITEPYLFKVITFKTNQAFRLVCRTKRTKLKNVYLFEGVTSFTT